MRIATLWCVLMLCAACAPSSGRAPRFMESVVTQPIDLNVCAFQSQSSVLSPPLAADFVEGVREEVIFQSVKKVYSLEDTRGCDLMLKLSQDMSVTHMDVYSAWTRNHLISLQTRIFLRSSTGKKLGNELKAVFDRGTPLYAQLVTERSAVPNTPLTATGTVEAPVITIISPDLSRSLKVVEKGSAITVNGIARSDSGIAKVTINGEEAGLDANGNFWADVLLKVGENRITVNAMGTNRKQKAETFTVVRETGTPASSNVAVAKDEPDLSGKGKYYALIIGINSYRYIDRLQTAVNDAKRVEQILKSNYLFETKVILDQAATRENIMNVMNDYRSRLTPDDKLLIYYAGHGVHDKVADASYWLPVDARKDNDTNWIDARNVTDQMKRMSARQVLVVADSCYSGTMTRSVDPTLASADTRENYLRKMQSKASRVLISSGGNEPVSDSGGKGHSIFAEVFIRALENPDRAVFTAEELHVKHIKESVAGRADQTPEYKVIRNSGHDGGDFVFVKKK